MINTLKINRPYIRKTCWKLIGNFATILTILSFFLSWEDIGLNNFKLKICFLAVILLVLIFTSTGYVCFFKKEKIIWQNSSGKIIVRYGDILKESFDKHGKEPKLYVIPVNSAFDTIVDTDISLCDNPLISFNTLHGKWIIKMNEKGKSTKDIDNAIQACIKKQKKEPIIILNEMQKDKGKKEVYALGTIAALRGINNNIFLLLALTNFDKNNNAHVSIDDLEMVIKSLIEFYDQHGQGYELIIPLMGTSLSRAGLTHEESLRVIVTKFLLYKNRIHGNVNIVIHSKDRDKVSVFSVV